MQSEEEIEAVAHAFNECCDYLTNDIQRMRNVRDGIGPTPAAYVEEMTEALDEILALVRPALKALQAAASVIPHTESEAVPVQQSGQRTVEDGGRARDRKLPVGTAPAASVTPDREKPVAFALPSELGWLQDPDHLGEPRILGFAFEAMNGEKSIPLYARPSKSYEDGVRDGYDACRNSVYAVCEDIQRQANALRIKGPIGSHSEEQHSKGYHAGTNFLSGQPLVGCRACHSSLQLWRSPRASLKDRSRE